MSEDQPKHIWMWYVIKYQMKRHRRFGFPLICAISFGLLFYNLSLLQNEYSFIISEPRNKALDSKIPPPPVETLAFDSSLRTTIEVVNNHTEPKLPFDEARFTAGFNPFQELDENWNTKVQRLANQHHVAKSDLRSDFSNSSITHVTIPVYYIEDYLLRNIESASGTLKSKIASLDQKVNKDSILTVATRHRPLFTNFEYRFSLSMYFAYVKTHVSTHKDLQSLKLPFNWYDFTDLGLLNEDIKFHFFWNWLVLNYDSFPESVKRDLLYLHFGSDITEEALDAHFDPVRQREKLTLNNFEMMIRELDVSINSCHVFNGDDSMSSGLINFVDAFYDWNFPHIAKDQSFKNNKFIQILSSIPNPFKTTPPEKLSQILKSDHHANCVNFEKLPQDHRVEFTEFLEDQKKYQPSIGYNVIHGTREQYHLVQRVLFGKSYLYNYNNINSEEVKPLKMSLLTDDTDDSLLQFGIEQAPTKDGERLLENRIVDSYIENHVMSNIRYDSLEKLYENRKSIKVSFVEEFKDLKSTLLDHANDIEHVVSETDDKIDYLIDYVRPKNEVELYVDSFVNLDSAEAIFRFHKLVPDQMFEERQKEMGASLRVDQVYEQILQENIGTPPTSTVSVSPNLFKFYKSIKFSNGFVNTKDVPKYFYEIRLLPDKPGQKAPNTAHYDWRFFTDNFHSPEQKRNSLSHLLAAWLKLTNKHKLKTWLAHGTLLGWYFNARNLPWDSDSDVQMPINDLNKLCFKFNQTVILEDPLKGLGMYFLDCGSSITHRSKENGRNNIDARFVDTKTGFYVDITGVSFSGSTTPDRYLDQIDWNTGKYIDRATEQQFYQDLEDSSDPESQHNSGYLKLLDKKMFKNLQCNLKLKIINCRNNHFSRLSDLLPLRKTLMEGEEAFVPNNYIQILEIEYRKKWKIPVYRNELFLTKIGSWVPMSPIKNYLRRFLGINKQNLEEASQKLGLEPMVVTEGMTSELDKKIGKQFRNIKDAKYTVPDNISEQVYEGYSYPFDYSGDAQNLLVLEMEQEHLFEYLRSKDLLEYHYRELKAFHEGKVLSEEERKSVVYARPDFYIEKVNGKN